MSHDVCGECGGDNLTMVGDPEYNDEWYCEDCKQIVARRLVEDGDGIHTFEMRKVPNNPNIFVPIIGTVDHYITLNQSAIHTIDKIIDLMKEKKFFVRKQNLALTRMRKAMERGDKSEVGASWNESRRWGRKANSIKVTPEDYAGSETPTTSAEG